MAAAEIIMPKMGDAMEEGRIVRWLKSVGDTVGPDDVVAEIETDKSNVEIPAEASGTLQSIAFREGDVVPVGTVIAVIGAGAPAAAGAPAGEGAGTAAAQPTPEATPAAPPPPARSNGAGPAPAAQAVEPAAALSPEPAAARPPAAPPASARPAVPAAAPSPLPSYDSFVGALPENLGGTASLVGEPVAAVAADAGSAERVKASPLARAIARSNNLDLAALQGSGPDGGIVKRDVEEALAGSAVSAPVAAAPPARPPAPTVAAAPALSEGDEVQEYNAMRRTIAKRLAESKSTIPHFYVTSEIDVEAMLALREQVNASASAGGAAGARKISLNDFLVKATANALALHPVVNSFFSDNQRVVRKSVNVGIAVSIEDGLIVPVVRDCQAKSLRAIAAETHPVIERAREMKLKPEEYTGGTFTISNLGQFDVENFAAIINPGEGAILAVASARQVPAVVDGQVVPRRRMKVTLCADHRVMDGVAGAQFLQELKRIIENPLQILI